MIGQVGFDGARKAFGHEEKREAKGRLTRRTRVQWYHGGIDTRFG